MGDIYFASKNFNAAMQYYQQAYQNYNHNDFLIKQYQSQVFDLSNKISQSILIKQSTDQLQKLIKNTEKLFDTNQSIQIKDAAANILSLAYRSFNLVHANEQYEISSSLYLIIHKIHIGLVPQAKQIFEATKKRLDKTKLNQTNKYLLELSQQMLKASKKDDDKDNKTDKESK